MNNIKENIETLRRRLGYSQDYLSAIAKIPLSTYQYRLANPGTFKLAEIDRIACVLHIPSQTILYGKLDYR